jgi:hypothetical protein
MFDQKNLIPSLGVKEFVYKVFRHQNAIASGPHPLGFSEERVPDGVIHGVV